MKYETELCIVVGKRLVIDGIESDIAVWHSWKRNM